MALKQWYQRRVLGVEAVVSTQSTDDFQGNNELDGAEGGDPAVAEEGVGLDTDVDTIVDKAVDGVIAGVREEDPGGIGVDEYLRGATD